MEKEIVWTANAQKDFWEIAIYLKESWPESVLSRFERALYLKTQLLQKQPYIGFKSNRFSRFRKTLVTKHYLLIYTISEEHIVIHKLKHVRLK